MTKSTKIISPLRQRMIDDMRMRKLLPKTQTGYNRAVKRFAGYLRRSPDTATAEDLRRFQLHLVDHGILPVSLNATLTGLKVVESRRHEVTLRSALYYLDGNRVNGLVDGGPRCIKSLRANRWVRRKCGWQKF